MRTRWMLMLLGLVLVGVGCDDDEKSAGVGREDVAEDAQLVGQVVTLRGVVNESYGDRAFEMAGEGALGRFGEGAEVLVVGDDLPLTAAGAEVEVTGTVAEYDPKTLIDEPVDPDVDLPGADDYERAVVARDVTVIRPSGTFEPN